MFAVLAELLILTLALALVISETLALAQLGELNALAEPSWWTITTKVISLLATADPKAEPATGWIVIDWIIPEVFAEPDPVPCCFTIVIELD